MKNSIKTAFDKIHAEDNLKNNTLAYLQARIKNQNVSRKPIIIKRLTSVVATFIVISASSLFWYNMYFSANAYIDLDVNPAVELTLNRFDRVINIHGYNSDGEKLYSNLTIKHKNYKEAIKTLIDAFKAEGFLQDDGSVFVTLQTNTREEELLSSIRSEVSSITTGLSTNAEIDVFPVDNHTRSNAHEMNLSPARYLAITELMKMDPAVTYEGCRGHSIGELKQLTKGHVQNHHNLEPSGDENDAVTIPNEASNGQNLDNQPPNGNANHHIENNNKVNHGGKHRNR